MDSQLKPPLLVFDLNGTLLLSEARFNTRRRIQPDCRAITKYIYYRPYLRDLLEFAFRHFEVGFWSSNSDINTFSAVDSVVRDLFHEKTLKKVFLVWGRSNCETSEVPGDWSSYKDLRRLKNLRPQNDVRYTFVDDSPDKIVGMEAGGKHTFYEIPSFEDPDAQCNDSELLRLKGWLERAYKIK